MSQASTRPIRARQPQEKLQRREDILRAAEQLWLTTSYPATSMQQIARESQLAKGTLYLYFKTKEELFTEMLILHLQEWLTAVSQRLQSAKSLSPESAIQILVQSVPPLSLRRLLVLMQTTLLPALSEEAGQKVRHTLLDLLSPLLQSLPFEQATSIRMLKHLYATAIGLHLIIDIPDSAVADIKSRDAEFIREFEISAASVLENLLRVTVNISE